MPESVDANAMAGTLGDVAFSKVSRNRWHRLAAAKIFDGYADNIGVREEAANPKIEVCFQTGNLLVMRKRDVKCTQCEHLGDMLAAASYLGKSRSPLDEDKDNDVMRVHYFCTMCESWVVTKVVEYRSLMLREEDYDMWMDRLSLRKNTRMRMSLVSSIGDIPLSVLAYAKGLSPVEVEPNTGILSCNVTDMRTARLESCKLSYECMVTEMCTLNGTRGPRFLRDIEYSHHEGGVCAELFESSMREVFTAVHDSADIHNTVLLAAPCGSGKTTLAIAVVQTLRETDLRGAKMLVLAPRSSLCDSLHAKFAAQQEIKADGTLGDEKEMVHHYNNGYNKHGAKVVVSTVESLSRTVCAPAMQGGKVVGARAPDYFDIVFVDEMHTLIKAVITQPTFKGQNARRQALRVLLLVLSRAKFVIFLDKDIGIIERLFVSLVVAQRCFGNPDQVQHRIWTLVSHHKVPIKYIRLKDDAAALNLAKMKLAEGCKVAVFEPSVARCRAFVEAISEAELAVNAVAMHAKSQDKAEFCADPDSYLERNRVDLLCYTTAIGVGVSIDGAPMPELGNSQELREVGEGVTPARFDVVIVCKRDFVGWQAGAQAEHRVRRTGSDSPGARVIYVVQENLHTNLRLHRAAHTVNDAMAAFNCMMAESSREVADFAFLARDDYRLGVLRIVPSALSMFCAAVFGAVWFADELHGTIAEHALVDSGAETVDSTITSTKEERKKLKRLREGRVEEEMSQAAAVQAGDSAAMVRRKVQALVDLGIGGEGWATLDGTGLFENPVFMRLAEKGVISQGNIDRLIAFDKGDGRGVDWMRVQLRTETTPMTQMDDETGPVVGREYRVLCPLFGAMGIPNLARLMDPETVVTVPIEDQLPTMEEMREMLASLKEHNYKRYGNITVRKNQTRRSLARVLANAYFGHRAVGEERKMGGVMDRGVIAVLLSLVPAYAQKSGLPAYVVPDEYKELANAYLAANELPAAASEAETDTEE